MSLSSSISIDGTVSCMTRRMPCHDRQDDDELPTSGRCPTASMASSTARSHRFSQTPLLWHHCFVRPKRQPLANFIEHCYNRVRPLGQGQTVPCHLLCHDRMHPQAQATMKANDGSCSIGSGTGRNTSCRRISEKSPCSPPLADPPLPLPCPPSLPPMAITRQHFWAKRKR